jgi:hypothetical protein
MTLCDEHVKFGPPHRIVRTISLAPVTQRADRKLCLYVAKYIVHELESSVELVLSRSVLQYCLIRSICFCLKSIVTSCVTHWLSDIPIV